MKSTKRLALNLGLADFFYRKTEELSLFTVDLFLFLRYSYSSKDHGLER